jgi:hypothetical protein
LSIGFLRIDWQVKGLRSVVFCGNHFGSRKNVLYEEIQLRMNDSAHKISEGTKWKRNGKS